MKRILSGFLAALLLLIQPSYVLAQTITPGGSGGGCTTDCTFGGTTTFTPAANSAAATSSTYSLTGANAQSLLDLSGTWNTSGTPIALKLNITDTASNSASMLADFRIGGVSKFFIGKDGLAQTVGGIGDSANNKFRLTTTGGMTLASGLPFAASAGNASVPDTYITRKAAASWQLGQADAASPVAQNLSVQSVVAGTSNTAGTDFTVKASQGTGTGAGGNIVFQTAPAGTTGTAQNALVTKWTINNAGFLGFSGASGDIMLSPTNSLSDGLYRQSTAIGVQTGGVKGVQMGGTGISLNSTANLSWVAGSDPNASTDTTIGRRAAATIRLGAVDAAAPVAQTLGVQSVVTGTSNIAGANFTLAGSQGTGTGLGGSVIIQTAPASTTGSTPNALRTVVTVDGNAHTNFGGTAPAAGGSCGTSPTMTSGSTDTAGQLNVGTGSPTSCTVTFATAYAAAPFCVVSALTTANMSAYTVSTSAITITTSTASAKVNYVCHGA